MTRTQPGSSGGSGSSNDGKAKVSHDPVNGTPACGGCPGHPPPPTPTTEPTPTPQGSPPGTPPFTCTDCNPPTPIPQGFPAPTPTPTPTPVPTSCTDGKIVGGKCIHNRHPIDDEGVACFDEAQKICEDGQDHSHDGFRGRCFHFGTHVRATYAEVLTTWS